VQIVHELLSSLINQILTANITSFEFKLSSFRNSKRAVL
jgi:hypothetical protein